MLLAALFVAASVSSAQSSLSASQAPNTTPNTCGTMRTYVLSKDPDHHIERVLTCVPLRSDYAKRARGAHFQPTTDSEQKARVLR